jgi:hypothetical protein
MGKRRTLTYNLSDGQKVTCREVADEIGISESAARNRLGRSDDPKIIFAPYSVKNGGHPRKIDRVKKAKKPLPYEDDMWKLVMKMGTNKHDS